MKKITVGFVGLGWMGSVLLRRLTERDDVQIAAVLEKNADRGREVLADLGLPDSLMADSYSDIVKNPDIDAVFIVSPNSFHGTQTIQAAEAGKHVFCEKPAATIFSEFRRQIELDRANPNLITFVDYIMNFDTMENHLRQMVAEGRLGQLTQIQVNYRHPVNIAGDKVWKLRKDVMGDAIGMGIIHALSVIVNLAASQAKPVAVYATSMPAAVRGFEAHPVWNIVIKFDNGATGFCFGNIDNSNGYDAYHNIYGTEGGFIFDSQLDRPQKVRYWSRQSAAGEWVYPLDAERCKTQGLEKLAWPADTTTPDSGNVIDHQTGTCVGHFIDCVKAGRKSPLGFAASAIVGEISWAAQMSAATGKEIPLPLNWDQAQEFFSC